LLIKTTHLTTHSTRRLDSMAFIILPRGVN
jgi:hypothetical protein